MQLFGEPNCNGPRFSCEISQCIRAAVCALVLWRRGTFPGLSIASVVTLKLAVSKIHGLIATMGPVDEPSLVEAQQRQPACDTAQVNKHVV